MTTTIKVFSWNFGKLSESKLDCIRTNVFGKNEESTSSITSLSILVSVLIMAFSTETAFLILLSADSIPQAV